MGFLDKVKKISEYPESSHTIIMGEPGSGKTTLAGTFPKPMLFVEIGQDKGGLILKNVEGIDQLEQPIDDILFSDEEVEQAKGTIKQGSIKIPCINSTIAFLKEAVAATDLPYKTIVIDPLTTTQEKYTQYIHNAKGGKNLNFDDWNLVANKMAEIFNLIDQLATKVNVVTISHIQARETKDDVSNTNYVKILPQFTESSAKRYLKNASYVWYVTPKTVLENGQQTIKRTTIIGGHPIIPTKSRIPNVNIDGMEFMDFTYDKLQALIKQGVNQEVVPTQVAKDVVAEAPITKAAPKKKVLGKKIEQVEGQLELEESTADISDVSNVISQAEKDHILNDMGFVPVSNDSLFE